MKYSNSELLKMYGQLYFGRNYELKITEKLATGKLPGFYHLAVGQEAIQLGIMNAIGSEDWIVPHPRCHPLFALHCGIKEFTAEMIGKSEGINGGMASYVHLYVPEKKIGPSNGVMGENQALGVGIALGYKMDKKKGAVVIGIGDGSFQEGVVSEVMNMAAIYNLPIVFYIESNNIAISTPIHGVASRLTKMVEKGKAFGLEGATYDGNNIIEVRETMEAALEKARRGEPNIVEYTTTRWRGHFEGDPALYRDPKVVEEAKKDDPILKYQKYLLENGYATEEQLRAIEKEQYEIINEAFEYAMNLPDTTPGNVINPDLVYAK